jgi:uroporphyrinogen III methyltransferase/synthase
MWGTRPEQRVVTAPLDRIAAQARAAGLTNPAVIVIGEIASLREKIRWFDARPLFGKRILVPRPKAQAVATARAIRERGAEPIVFPLIEIHGPPDPEALVTAARQVSSYDWVVFTSANAVERFFAALAEAGRDLRTFGAARIAVIGTKTAAALEQLGLRPDLVAEEQVGEGIAAELVARAPRRVLIPRARDAREVLPDTLRASGVEVDVVVAYETRAVSAERAEELAALLESRGVEIVLFTSSSTVSSMLGLLGARATELLSGVTVASIGPETTRALSEAGIRVDVSAERYSIDGLLDALES